MFIGLNKIYNDSIFGSFQRKIIKTNIASELLSIFLRENLNKWTYINRICPSYYRICSFCNYFKLINEICINPDLKDYSNVIEINDFCDLSNTFLNYKKYASIISKNDVLLHYNNNSNILINTNQDKFVYLSNHIVNHILDHYDDHFEELLLNIYDILCSFDYMSCNFKIDLAEQNDKVKSFIEAKKQLDLV